MPSRKEALSNFDIRLFIKDLEKYKGGFLQKVYQPERDTLLLRLYSKEAGKGQLLIKLGSYLALRKELPENPIRPSQFVMLARKLLNNAILRDIRQHKFDRIVIFELEKRKILYLLIFEMFGTGNVILVDKESGLIVRVLMPRSWKDRELRAKQIYQFPPSQPDLPELGKAEFKKALSSSSKDLIRTLTLELKMEGNLAEELITRAGLEKGVLAEELGQEEVEGLYQAMSDFFLQVDGGGEEGVGAPVVVYKKGDPDPRPFDVIPLKYSIYSPEVFRMVEQPDFNSCVELLFPLAGEEAQKKEGKKQEEESALAEEEQFRSKLLMKLHKRLKIQEASILIMEEKIAKNGEVANQIFVNYSKYEALLNQIRENVEAKGGERFKERVEDGEVDFIKSVDLKNSCLTVKFPEDEHWLTLCWKETLNQNAQRYYGAIKKQKKKKSGAGKAVEVTRQ